MAEKEPRILDRLRRDQLASDDAVVVRSLGGGVSSDVFLVQDKGKRFVVKQALPYLKVQDEWPADLSRNRVEYEFLLYLNRLLPEAAPAAFAAGDDYFVMEYLGAEYSNWKELLLNGDCREHHAVKAARILGTLHRASFGNDELARRFDTTRNFHQLRTDPYLLTAGKRNPPLREYFEQEAIRLESTRQCLVHGDYSPKNMLIGEGRMVLLDCEVAWYGDPAFDLGFLLNHLLLKALYHAPREVGLQPMIAAAVETYYRERKLDGESQRELDCRTARLLLMLLLARIDGKSPVEYLTSESERGFVRSFVSAALTRPRPSLAEVISGWFAALEQLGTSRQS